MSFSLIARKILGAALTIAGTGALVLCLKVVATGTMVLPVGFAGLPLPLPMGIPLSCAFAVGLIFGPVVFCSGQPSADHVSK